MEHGIEPSAGSAPRRFAALLSIALVGLLIVGAAVAAAAGAPAPVPSRGGLASAAAEAEEEVEWPLEEGEGEIEVELEFEEAPPLPTGSEPAAECVVQSARARVVASDVSNTLRLSLRYASRQPVHVEVHYGAGGARRAAPLDPMTLPATRHGRIDYSERPGDRRMSEVRAARALFVTVEASGPSCRSHSTRRLTQRERRPTRTVWSEAPRRPLAHR
jgi:hypothetical protein